MHIHTLDFLLVVTVFYCLTKHPFLSFLLTWSQSQEQDRKNETLSSPIGPQVPSGSTLEKILVPQIFFVNVLLRALSLLSIIEQFYFNRTLLLNFELDYS